MIFLSNWWIIPKFFLSEPQEFEQSKVSECQNRSIHDSMWSPNFIRPILLFNKDDSIFNSSIQSRFGDNLKDMLPCSSNFNREVEIKENNEKELTLKFDLQDYKVNILNILYTLNKSIMGTTKLFINIIHCNLFYLFTA